MNIRFWTVCGLVLMMMLSACAAAGAIVGSLSGQDDSYRLWGKQA